MRDSDRCIIVAMVGFGFRADQLIGSSFESGQRTDRECSQTSPFRNSGYFFARVTGTGQKILQNLKK
jgi:hypothetical protein